MFRDLIFQKEVEATKRLILIATQNETLVEFITKFGFDTDKRWKITTSLNESSRRNKLVVLSMLLSRLSLERLRNLCQQLQYSGYW